MRQKEEEIAQLKGQLEAVKGRVATIEEVEQREKEIEKMLRQTHSDMVGEGVWNLMIFDTSCVIIRPSCTRTASLC